MVLLFMVSSQKFSVYESAGRAGNMVTFSRRVEFPPKLY